MIERRAYNPVESILQFRRIVEVMARVPGSLNVQNVAMHMCSYKMMQILDVDMVSIYLFSQLWILHTTFHNIRLYKKTW